MMKLKKIFVFNSELTETLLKRKQCVIKKITKIRKKQKQKSIQYTYIEDCSKGAVIDTH